MNLNIENLERKNWNNPLVYLVDGKQVIVSDNYPLFNYNVININNYKKQRLNDKKTVKFNLDKNKIEYTYSKDEYDRKPIDSFYNFKYIQKMMKNSCLNISRYYINEWNKIFRELNNYKMFEMEIHKDSINNLNIHK